MNQIRYGLEKCGVFVPVVSISIFSQTQHAKAGVLLILKRQMHWRGPNQTEVITLFQRLMKMQSRFMTGRKIHVGKIPEADESEAYIIFYQHSGEINNTTKFHIPKQNDRILPEANDTKCGKTFESLKTFLPNRGEMTKF